MSGLDEQYLNKCPLCNKLPSYWVLGNSGTRGGLVWIYTERYPRIYARSSIRFSVFNTPENIDAINQYMDYLLCGECRNRIRDMSIVSLMYKRAKELERKGRVDIREWT